MTNNKIIKEDLHRITGVKLPWHNFANQTVLVTGAGGFLPAYMVETLLYLNEINAGYNITVLALVRNLEKAKQRFADYLNDKNLIFIEQDVCEEIATDRPVDFIIHAASKASPKFYNVDPVGTFSANILGTINLLELAKKNNTKSFLYFSSAEVYGQPTNNDIPIKEDSYGYLDPTMIRSCYAESKRMGENMCVSYAHQYGLNTKIIRPFHTFGPGMDLADGRVFVDFVSDVLNNRDIIMKSDGLARRAYCYITDAIIAYFKVMLNGEVATPYNVGNPFNEYSVLELANLLATLFSDKKLKVLTHQEADKNYLPSNVNRVIPDIAKLSQLEWTPRIAIADGFYRTIMSYMNI